MTSPTTCPICNKPLEPDAARNSRYFPFCSERCRWVDLFRWLDGKYAIVEPLDPQRLLEETSSEVGLDVDQPGNADADEQP